MTWGHKDKTTYKFANLAINDSDHAYYDDVRSAAMAIAQFRTQGVSGLLDSHLLLTDENDIVSYEDIISKGLEELQQLLLAFKKKW